MKIICIARNYADHAAELDRPTPSGSCADFPNAPRRPNEVTERTGYGATGAASETPCEKAADGPVFFLKPDTALLRNNDPFYIPSFSREVHYECELVVKITRLAKCIDRRFARRCYDEVGLGIDFTARDLQRDAMAHGLPWETCKAFDHSAALSPRFVPLAELGGDVQRLEFEMLLNGEVCQRGRTAEMLHTVDEIISHVSRFMTLRIGDLIFTGTPAGVGPVHEGDNIRAVLEGRTLLDFDIR